MPEPITLDDGSVIEDFDSRSITVRGPGGKVTRMARSLAPDRFQVAVDEREQTPAQAPFQVAGPVMDLPAMAEHAAQLAAQAQAQPPSIEGRQVFDPAGRRLDQLAPETPKVSPVRLGDGTVLEQESPEAFQRRRGEVRAPEPATAPGRVTFRKPDVARATGPQFATSTATTTTRTGTRLTPEAQASLQESRARGDEATGRIQESLRQEGVDLALAGQERRDLLAESDRRTAAFGQQRTDVEAANKERERALFEQQEALRKEIEDSPIDEGRLWRKKSTGKKIALAIGAFLSGFARRGQGQNPILQQIEGEINRDIEAQREVVNNKRVALNKLSGLYAQARQRGIDDLQAVEVAKGAYMAHVESHMRELGERAQNASLQAALARKADEFSLRTEESRQQFILAGADKVQTTTKRARVPVSGVPAGGPVNDKGQAIVIPGLQPTGAQTTPLNKTDLQKLRDGASAYRNLEQAVLKMIAIRERAGTEAFTTKDSSEFSALANAGVISGLTKLGNTGVLNAGEREVYKELTPIDLGPRFSDVRRFGGTDPLVEQLRGLLSAVRSSANNNLGTRGFMLESGPTLQSRSEGVAR